MMKKLMMVFAVALSLNAFAEAPKEPVQLAGSYDPKAPSISVQGLGNKILDAATTPKYLVFNLAGHEYAYSFKRLGSNDVKYIGKPSDVQGLVFFDVTAYDNGKKISSQTTTYRQSKYAGAIRLEKFDRDEKRPYQFDLGLDSEDRLFVIDKVSNVTYFTPAEKIRQPAAYKDSNKKFNF